MHPDLKWVQHFFWLLQSISTLTQSAALVQLCSAWLRLQLLLESCSNVPSDLKPSDMQHHTCANIFPNRSSLWDIGSECRTKSRKKACTVLYYATGKDVFAAAHLLQQNPPTCKLMHTFSSEICLSLCQLHQTLKLLCAAKLTLCSLSCLTKVCFDWLWTDTTPART